MNNFDRDHIWHPYTSMIDPLPTYTVKGAAGVYIELETGQRLIDGMSSWWCAVHGYNHPALNAAAHAQIDRFSHVMFGGLTHRPAIELGERLLSIAPKGLTRIFYSDSGSVSIEVAVKMALQYAQATGHPRRTKLATALGGYHGDTWHAMSVCDPEGGMHSLYAGRLPVQFFAPRPPREWSEEAFAPMREMLEKNADEIAAVIIEPIVQGTGGMWFYAPEYLLRLREECTRHGILLITDEIATGFWRTGSRWGCDRVRARTGQIPNDPDTPSKTSHAADNEPLGCDRVRARTEQILNDPDTPLKTSHSVNEPQEGITPDILCVGKALTGGYMSFAATLTTDEVALGISSAPPHSFMHGPTFMGNPLAAAVACASLELLEDPGLPARIANIERRMKEWLAPAADFDGVADVRVLGAIGVVEIREGVDVGAFQRRCVERGVWIRPFGRLVYIMPPYIITDDELRKLCGELVELVR